MMWDVSRDSKDSNDWAQLTLHAHSNYSCSIWICYMLKFNPVSYFFVSFLRRLFIICKVACFSFPYIFQNMIYDTWLSRYLCMLSKNSFNCVYLASFSEVKKLIKNLYVRKHCSAMAKSRLRILSFINHLCVAGVHT